MPDADARRVVRQRQSRRRVVDVAHASAGCRLSNSADCYQDWAVWRRTLYVWSAADEKTVTARRGRKGGNAGHRGSTVASLAAVHDVAARLLRACAGDLPT